MISSPSCCCCYGCHLAYNASLSSVSSEKQIPREGFPGLASRSRVHGLVGTAISTPSELPIATVTRLLSSYPLRRCSCGSPATATASGTRISSRFVPSTVTASGSSAVPWLLRRTGHWSVVGDSTNGDGCASLEAIEKNFAASSSSSSRREHHLETHSYCESRIAFGTTRWCCPSRGRGILHGCRGDFGLDRAATWIAFGCSCWYWCPCPMVAAVGFGCCCSSCLSAEEVTE